MTPGNNTNSFGAHDAVLRLRSELARLRSAALSGDDMRAALAGNSAGFAKFFFRRHCRLAFSPMHLASFGRHNRLAAEPLPGREGARLALAAPRGNAKSTIHSLILPVMDVCYQRESHIVIISATFAQAALRLRNIRDEILTNETLRAAFQTAVEARTQCNRQTLCVNGVRLDAFGAGAEIRGISHGATRPTKIILDDVEDSTRAMSETARAETLAWYNEVVENLGDSYTHIEVVGTILHPDSLLATLVRSPHFEGRVYRSVEAWAERGDLWDRWRTILANPSDAGRLDSARSFFLANREAMLRGTRVLWERKESYEQLMMQLATRGRVAFFKEKQNEPLSAGSRVFDTAAWLRFIHDEAGGQLSFPSADAASGAPVAVRALRVCGFLDPALGGGASRRRGDFAAIVTVATDGAGAYFVLDAWIDRAPPARQIERIFDLHARWHFDLFGYEANHFQSLLAAPIELERARRREHGRLWQLPLRAVRHTERKEARIAALEPLAANGWLRFSRSLPEEFFAQADAFPCGRHDDAIDALAGAVELAKSFSCGTGIVTLRGRRSVRAKGY